MPGLRHGPHPLLISPSPHPLFVLPHTSGSARFLLAHLLSSLFPPLRFVSPARRLFFLQQLQIIKFLDECGEQFLLLGCAVLARLFLQGGHGEIHNVVPLWCQPNRSTVCFSGEDVDWFD
jgi:hypothetical protein